MRKLPVISDQLSVISDQEAGISDQLSVISDQLPVISDQLSVISDQEAGISNQLSVASYRLSGFRSQVSCFRGRAKAVVLFMVISIIATWNLPLATGANDAPELTVKASAAIDRGLKHLLEAQREDGSWAATEDGGRGVAITSLALMAFMSRAEFPGSGPNGEALNRAKDWLLKKAKEAPDGYLGSTMYEHGLATLALTELWGMTRDKEEDDEIQKAIQKAVEVILRSQNAGGGWRYQPSSDAGQDTSVTVMVFIALASARQAGIVVPNETIAKVVTYFESATSQKTGGFNYVPTGVQKNDSIACTGGGAYAAQLAGERGSEMVMSAIRFLKERAPGIIDGNFGHYYYGHYYAAQAMVQAGDEYYADWYPQIRDALIKKQNPDGSWGGKKNKKGTKVASYETPMAIITLAIPHRYIPIYQR